METLLTNKKGYFDFEIEEEYIAGIVLYGNEVKSIRNKDISFSDSYVYVENSEVFLHNMSISRYKNSNKYELDKIDEKRVRKLLLNRSEINKIHKKVKERGYTIVPLSLMEKDGKIKIKIGIAKGKKLYDKKQSIKERDMERNLE